MIRLLRANMGRLKKETAFWAAIIFMVFYALCVCLMAKYSMDLNDNSLPPGWIIFIRLWADRADRCSRAGDGGGVQPVRRYRIQ